MSKPYAEVIGDPIGQSKSPLIHNFWLEKLDIEAEYRATHVTAEGLEGYFAERRDDPDWRGCNVTIPHKGNVRVHLGGETEAADSVGAVNTVLPYGTLLAGHNSDIRGVACALGDVADKTAALIGNGGAALAALAMLKAGDAAEVRIVARDIGKSKTLLEDFGLDGHALALGKADIGLDRADIVINATPLGMDGASPMPSALLRALSRTGEDALVFDMVYAPLETALLKAAKAFDRKTVDGLVMLVEQAREAFFLFFQEELTEESEALLHRHDAELRELLTR